jgi:hypothetical protein
MRWSALIVGVLFLQACSSNDWVVLHVGNITISEEQTEIPLSEALRETAPFNRVCLLIEEGITANTEKWSLKKGSVEIYPTAHLVAKNGSVALYEERSFLVRGPRNSYICLAGQPGASRSNYEALFLSANTEFNTTEVVWRSYEK